LAEGGHQVHTPDLFDGELPASIEDGLAYAGKLPDDAADRALDGLPADVVYAGMSWGVMSAQRLAQTRPGARGALLYESCVPISGDWAFGPWPDGVPVQIHGMDADPFFAGEGDIDAAREIVATVADAELFTYPGDRHLFLDPTLPTYDADATANVLIRSRKLLDRLG
jgi:dienelactone hydrolase